MISLLVGAVVGAAAQAGPTVAGPVVAVPVVVRATPVGAGQPVAAVRAQSLISLPRLFSTDDYPQAALRNEEQGTTAVALVVGRAGQVTGCSITVSSGSAALDATTCSILQRRARFMPARDAKGKAVEDSSSARIRWVLPPRPPMELADRYQRLVLTIDGAGRITRCRGELSGKGPPPPPALCESGKGVAARIIAGANRDIGFAGRELALESGLRVGGSEDVLGADAPRGKGWFRLSRSPSRSTRRERSCNVATPTTCPKWATWPALAPK